MVKSFAFLIICLLLIASIPYAISPVYDFPEPQRFRGDSLYNPYQGYHGAWYQANLQAHSAAWGGLTNGKLTVSDAYSVYENLGYDIVGLTNYQLISRTPVPSEHYIPMYEHGFNLYKRHQLVIGAKYVIWTDFLFFQTIHHKQYLLKMLRPTTDVLVIAHPEFLDGYVPEDFQSLTNYDYVEILNNYRLSLEQWDAALSAGKLVWGMGNDDSHDQFNSDEIGRHWNMIGAASTENNDVITALQNGLIYCVAGNNGKNDNYPEYVLVDSMTIIVVCENEANDFRFIGQDGTVQSIVSQTDSAVYHFKPDDTYIRTEIVNDETVMYLNPVIRYNGSLPEMGEAEVNILYTWFYRFSFGIGYAGVGFLFMKYYRRRKKLRRKRKR